MSLIELCWKGVLVFFASTAVAVILIADPPSPRLDIVKCVILGGGKKRSRARNKPGVRRRNSVGLLEAISSPALHADNKFIVVNCSPNHEPEYILKDSIDSIALEGSEQDREVGYREIIKQLRRALREQYKANQDHLQVKVLIERQLEAERSIRIQAEEKELLLRQELAKHKREAEATIQASSRRIAQLEEQCRTLEATIFNQARKRDGTAEENNVAARIEGLMLILKQKQIELEAERRAKQKAEELCLSVQSQLEEARQTAAKEAYETNKQLEEMRAEMERLNHENQLLRRKLRELTDGLASPAPPSSLPEEPHEQHTPPYIPVTPLRVQPPSPQPPSPLPDPRNSFVPSLLWGEVATAPTYQ